MAVVWDDYVNNLALILMWIGAWSLTDIGVTKFFKNNQVKVYFLIFLIGSILVIFENYY
jgi:uncharacterized membrane protein YwzB